MPGVGLEPTWELTQGVLSPQRLPISPPRPGRARRRNLAFRARGTRWQEARARGWHDSFMNLVPDARPEAHARRPPPLAESAAFGAALAVPLETARRRRGPGLRTRRV